MSQTTFTMPSLLTESQSGLNIDAHNTTPHATADHRESPASVTWRVQITNPRWKACVSLSAPNAQGQFRSDPFHYNVSHSEATR